MGIDSITARLLGGLPRFAVRRPKLVVALALLVTLAAAPGLGRLTLRTDGHALVSEGDPVVLHDRDVRAEFGIDDNIVVLLHSRHPDGIFNATTLRHLRELTTNIATIPGLRTSNVLSLATEPNFRFRTGTLQLEPLLEPRRETPAEIAQLRDDVRRIKLYTGTFVSFDEKSAAILVGAPAGVDRTKLYEAVRARAGAWTNATDDIHVIGAPVAEALLGIHILEDLGVPRSLLGAGAGISGKPAPWKFPTSLYEWRLLIAQRVGLLPLAIAVMALVFFVSFRRVTATLLPLMEVGACLLFVFGLMGWTGVPIYLTIAVMPVILTAMGVSDEIYIFSRYAELVRASPGSPHAPVVAGVMEELWRPIVNMAVTTAVGFLSFALSSVGPVQAFGIFTAVGIVFCVLWSLLVIPAMLVLLKPAWLLPRGQAGTKSRAEGVSFGRFADGVLRRRGLVLGGTALLVALSLFGVRRVTVQDSWIDGFAPESEFFRATKLVNDTFHGVHVLLVRVATEDKHATALIPWAATNDNSFPLPAALGFKAPELVGSWITFTGNPKTTAEPFSRHVPAAVWRSWVQFSTNRNGQIWVTTPSEEGSPRFWLQPTNREPIRIAIASSAQLRPEVLRRIAELGRFIRARSDCAVGGVLDAADYVATTRFMLRPNDESARRLPDNPQQVRALWDQYRLARGAGRLRQAVETNYAHSLTTVFLKDANFVDTARLMREIRAYARPQLAPHGITLSFAGDVAVSQSLIEGIVSTQVRSLAGSLLGIWVVVSLLTRSWRGGFYCVVPSALAVVVTFAVMGWADIPLGVATSMFAGMTLGMGVDFAIHLLEQFQSARRGGALVEGAVRDAVKRVGPAVIVNGLGVALGFGVLMLSQVPANARLGALVVLGVVNCLVATLLILPVLLCVWPPKEKEQGTPAPSVTPV